MLGHMVMRKLYASSERFLKHTHEQAYLLTKGDPARPAEPLADVLDWSYTGNSHHPTEKPLSVLKPLIRSFSKPSAIVLDPFCGLGSTLLAAQNNNRAFVGIELTTGMCRPVDDDSADTLPP